MNYIKHSMAAHEHLRQRPEARPHHVSLYWALFFVWNAEHFPDELPVSRPDLMAAAHIGNKDTYLSTLRDLEAWGLLAYQPSRSSASTVQLRVLDGSAEVGPEMGRARPKSGPTKTAEVGPKVGQHVGPEMGRPTPEVGPKVGKHSLLYQTDDLNSVQTGSGGTEKKIGEVFLGEGFSEVQVLDDTASFDEPVPAPGAAPKKKVAPKKKGVGQGPQVAPTSTTSSPSGARRRGGRPQRPEVPFAESELATPEAFAAAFVGTDYALADLRYYHALVGNWRKDGEPPLRRDWKATATKFMLNDAADNRLKLAPTVQQYQPGASNSDTMGSGIPTTGYRSKRWD